MLRGSHFYPRPPGGGRPGFNNPQVTILPIFLSTPSGWRATHGIFCPARAVSDFYPRPPGGGRHADGYGAGCDARHFYPRPPGGGRPIVAAHIKAEQDKFLSTPSGWRATGKPKRRRPACRIFLSTPSGWRATLYHSDIILSIENFYPRPPGGGRPLRRRREQPRRRFLSTPSGWRATAKTDKGFVCFCAKGRRICLFKTRKEKICRWRFKKDKFWVLIWCEGSGKGVCASVSHCG